MKIMKKMSGLFFLFACSFFLISCGKKADPIILPDAEDIVSIDVTIDGTVVNHADREWIGKVISDISDADPTGRQSIQDTPQTGDYVKIEFRFEKGTSMLFAYKDGNKYFVEQPYQGIYEIEDGLYERITYYTDEGDAPKCRLWYRLSGYRL